MIISLVPRSVLLGRADARRPLDWQVLRRQAVPGATLPFLGLPLPFHCFSLAFHCRLTASPWPSHCRQVEKATESFKVLAVAILAVKHPRFTMSLRLKRRHVGGVDRVDHLCSAATLPRMAAHCQRVREEGRHFAVYLFVHTQNSQKEGPFSVARLKMDLPFHDRFAYSRVHRKSASPQDLSAGALFSDLASRVLLQPHPQLAVRPVRAG